MRKIIKINLSALTIVLAFSSMSCNIYEPIFGCSSITANPSVDINTLLSYPETIQIDGKTFQADASFSRVANINSKQCDNAGFVTFFDRTKYERLTNNYKYEYFWIVNETRKEVWENKSFISNDRLKNTSDISMTGVPRWNDHSDIFYGIAKISDDKNNIYYIKSKFRQ